MPAKSGRQYRMMAAIASGKKKGIGGLSPEKAREFMRKTPKKKRSMFAKGKD